MAFEGSKFQTDINEKYVRQKFKGAVFSFGSDGMDSRIVGS